MSEIVRVDHLNKTFKIEVKKGNFLSRLHSLFQPEYTLKEAVSDVSFRVEKGEKIAFLGPNGAGKSTTIKILTGILYPTSGSIRVCGMDPIKDRREFVYKIGAIFWQTSKLWYHLTSYDTFELLGNMYSVSPVEFTRKIRYLIDAFDIGDFLHVPVRKLSLGQRMRSELVASLIHSPEILFLDEPTIGLDMIAKEKLREVINDINRKEETTIFLTSHDIGDVEEICDRVIIINYGKIVYDGSIETLKKDHMKTKILNIHLKNSNDFRPLHSMNVIERKPGFVSVSIPSGEESILSSFEHLRKYELEDLSVENPDTESIIKTFY